MQADKLPLSAYHVREDSTVLVLRTASEASRQQLDQQQQRAQRLDRLKASAAAIARRGDGRWGWESLLPEGSGGQEGSNALCRCSQIVW